MRLRLRLKPLSRQGSDGKINHHRLNLMSNPRRVEGPPIIYIQPTKGFRREERSEHDCDFNRKIPTGGGGWHYE